MPYLIALLVILLVIYIYKKYSNNEQTVEVKWLDDEESNSDSIDVEELLKDNVDYQDTKARLKKQDEQIIRINKARELIAEKQIDEGIKILEEIMFKEKLKVRGRGWPTVLLEAYYKNKMYEKAWQYLNFMEDEFPDWKEKTTEYRMKISDKEGRPIDALEFMLQNIVRKEINTDADYRSSKEKILKTITPKIKKAGFLKYQDYIFDVVTKLIASNEPNYQVYIRKSLKSVMEEEQKQSPV